MTEGNRVRWPPETGQPWSAVALTTLPAFLEPRLEAGGNGVAVVFDDGFELSCADLLDHTRRLTAYFRQRLEPGDRIGVAVGNRAEFLIAIFAAVAARCVYVTINPAAKASDAAYMIQDSQSRLVIAGAEALPTMRAIASDCPSLLEVLEVSADSEPAGLEPYYRDLCPEPLVDPHADTAEYTDIGYTSGTTGLPKALAACHDELLHYLDNFYLISSFSDQDRILCPLQLHYGDPVWMVLASIDKQTPMIVMRRFSVSRFWPVAKDFGATALFSIGSIPNLLLTAKPSADERDHQVRIAWSVAVPARQHQELHDRFGFPWIEVYGTSEGGPLIAMPEHCAAEYVGTGAIGIPVPGVEVRLVNETGEVIDGAGTGEFEAKPVTGFAGYLASPEATAEALKDGWYRSGDLLRRDEDGIYYFVGRARERIRRGGENISPTEVEAMLREHPDVTDVAVVPVGDEVWGEEVKAYVELVEGASFEPADLIAHASERLAPFKVPRYIELREEPFPRTPSQRIPKSELMVGGEHTISDAWDRQAQQAAKKVS